MSLPKRLTVEYDDGSTKAVDFEKLDGETRLTLTKLGLWLPPTMGTSKHYVLLEWDDWTEVLGMDTDTVDLLRYFIIRRIEDRGRLSFHVGSEDPVLFVIKRLPKELKGIVVANATGMKRYDFSSDLERWEGVFESGGKIEYVKYDKTDSRYRNGTTQTSETSARLRGALKRELNARNLLPENLLRLEEVQRVEVYWQIAKAMGIRGKERQADVYGFVELMVRALAASSL